MPTRELDADSSSAERSRFGAQMDDDGERDDRRGQSGYAAQAASRHPHVSALHSSIEFTVFMRECPSFLGHAMFLALDRAANGGAAAH